MNLWNEENTDGNGDCGSLLNEENTDGNGDCGSLLNKENADCNGDCGSLSNEENTDGNGDCNRCFKSKERKAVKNLRLFNTTARVCCILNSS